MAMDFLSKFFIEPMTNPAVQGYNIVNTVVFLAILVVAAYAIYRAFRNKIKFDYKFFLALLPYIFFGISMRVIMHRIESGNLVLEGITKTASPLAPGFWFFTPGIWIITFALVLAGLAIGTVWKGLKKKRLFLFGCIAMGWPLFFNFVSFNNWFWFFFAGAAIAIASYGICWAISRFTPYKILKDPLNIFIVAGQGIDGIASAIAISFFSFTEQHVFSAMLMDLHPAAFVAAKLGIAVLISYSLDDYLKENPGKKQAIGFVKILIAILGFATGLASLFKLGII